MRIEIAETCLWMASKGRLRLPWNISPGDSPFEALSLTTEEEWERYEWNPPQMSPELGYDASASPKPSWPILLENWNLMRVEQLEVENLSLLNIEATVRIGYVYHPDAQRYPEKEWHVRLAGRDLAAEDAERERLIARHNQIRTRIENATTASALLSMQNLLDNDLVWNSVQLPDTFPS